MPFAAGTYTLPAGNPVNTNTTISSSWANTTLSDVATALTTCVLKNGTQTITANIPMGGFKLTGLAAGNASGDSVRYEQVLLLTGGTMTGNILFTDGLYNIGAPGSGRPLNLYLAGTISVSGVTATGVTGSGQLVFATTPTLAGVPAAPTATFGAASTQIATTAYAENMRVTLGTSQASTSGTAITFTGIPAGVHRVIMTLAGVSTNGTSNMQIQIGDSGGLSAVGYLSGSAGASNAAALGTTAAAVTTGFELMTSPAQAAAAVWQGTFTLTLVDASTFSWVSSHNLYRSDSSIAFYGAGSKSLSAALDRLSLTTIGGADTFDAGVVNIAYEY